MSVVAEPASDRAAEKRLTAKQSRDRLWFTIHSWIGLKLSLLMTFILATGTIAVFSYEIDWLLNPEMRANQRIAEDEVAWGAAFDSMRREYPAYRPLNLSRFQDNWFALQMLAQGSGGELVRVWFNPADGANLGMTSFFNVQRLFRELHRHLMLPLYIGIPLVTVLAFPLLISLVAGFVVYKKFWRGLFKWPRFGRNPRIWNGDLHRLLGLWGSWFIALIAITSIWYLVEQLGGRAPPFPAAEREMADRNAALPQQFDGAAIDLALQNARSELAGLEPGRILFPGNASAPLTIQGELSAVLVRPRANGVHIDPASLAVVGSYRGEDLDSHTRISEASDPLHFGYFGGIGTKLLWFILGLMMTAMSITGVVINAARLRRSWLESATFSPPRRSGQSANPAGRPRNA